MRLAHPRLRLALAGLTVIFFVGGGALDRSRIAAGQKPFLITSWQSRLGNKRETFHSPIYEAERFWVSGGDEQGWSIKAGKFQFKWLHFWIVIAISLLFPKLFERIEPNN